MKKILSILVICMALVLTGCSGGNYAIYIGEYGEINEFYNIAKDYNYFTKAGATTSQIDSFYEEIKSEFVLLTASQITNFEAKLKNDDKLTDAQKKAYLSAVDIKLGESEDSLVLNYSFYNTDVWYYFLGVDINKEEPDNSGSKKEDNFLTYNIVSRGKTRYASNVSTDEGMISLGEFIYLKFESLVKTFMGEQVLSRLILPDLTYSYAITNSRLHSNADFVSRDGKYYVHSWQVPRDNISREIKLFYIEANRGIWYVLTLSLALLIVGTILVIWLIRDNKKKNIEKQGTL